MGRTCRLTCASRSSPRVQAIQLHIDRITATPRDMDSWSNVRAWRGHSSTCMHFFARSNKDNQVMFIQWFLESGKIIIITTAKQLVVRSFKSHHNWFTSGVLTLPRLDSTSLVSKRGSQLYSHRSTFESTMCPTENNSSFLKLQYLAAPCEGFTQHSEKYIVCTAAKFRPTGCT